MLFTFTFGKYNKPHTCIVTRENSDTLKYYFKNI